MLIVNSISPKKSIDKCPGMLSTKIFTNMPSESANLPQRKDTQTTGTSETATHLFSTRSIKSKSEVLFQILSSIQKKASKNIKRPIAI